MLVSHALPEEEERQKEGGGTGPGTHRSHLVMSCAAMSIMSGNMPRMAAVLNTGMSRRSVCAPAKVMQKGDEHMDAWTHEV